MKAPAEIRQPFLVRWSGPVVLEPHLQNSPAVLATVENGLGLNANKSLADLRCSPSVLSCTLA